VGPAGPRGLPLFKPPYGRITALDMNKGEIRWQVANGDGPRDNPAIAQLHLGPLGNPGLAGPLVTKTLLFAGEGSTPWSTRRAFRPACRSSRERNTARRGFVPTTRRPAKFSRRSPCPLARRARR